MPTIEIVPAARISCCMVPPFYYRPGRCTMRRCIWLSTISENAVVQERPQFSRQGLKYTPIRILTLVKHAVILHTFDVLLPVDRA